MVAKIAHLPHPRLLDEVGLEAALYWYVDGFAKRSKIKVDLDYPPHYERLPGEVEIALFRIVEECLTNIHRHSGSQTASIRFTRSASEIIFEVRDNGKGIPPEQLAPLASASTMGIGLSGMQERLKQLGGVLRSIQMATALRSLQRCHMTRRITDNGTKVLPRTGAFSSVLNLLQNLSTKSFEHGDAQERR